MSHKSLAIVKSLLSGGVSIRPVDRTHVLKTPGDVTDIMHN